MADQVTIQPEMTGPNAPTEATQEGQQSTEGKQGADRPSWLPDNFKSVEDFKKSYDELRADHTRKAQELAELKKVQKPAEQDDSQVSSTKDEKPDKKPAEGDESKDEAAMQDEAGKALEQAGLNIQDFQKEYAETGELSEDSRKALNEKGFSDEMINAYIEGVQAIRERSEAQVLAEVGIKDRTEYQRIQQWAVANLDRAYLDSFNEAVESGSKEKATLALEGLKARYDRAYGKEPNLVHGGKADPSNTAFNSVAEMTQAMSDPRYKTDEAFRQQVARRLANSKHLNQTRL